LFYFYDGGGLEMVAAERFRQDYSICDGVAPEDDPEGDYYISDDTHVWHYVGELFNSVLYAMFTTHRFGYLDLADDDYETYERMALVELDRRFPEAVPWHLPDALEQEIVASLANQLAEHIKQRHDREDAAAAAQFEMALDAARVAEAARTARREAYHAHTDSHPATL
jgi:hypothetical protein